MEYVTEKKGNQTKREDQLRRMRQGDLYYMLILNDEGTYNREGPYTWIEGMREYNSYSKSCDKMTFYLVKESIQAVHIPFDVPPMIAA